ncbi:MAG: hypothetical protein LYZ66_02190 [Nitrososphaerales archaeon]|nr:hypothetical protein [Nitrososphaerales archaeon]
MCAKVLYTKRIKGKLYPKAARTGSYAFAEGVSRVHGKIVSSYVGIGRVPEAADVIEIGGKADGHFSSEPE